MNTLFIVLLVLTLFFAILSAVLIRSLFRSLDEVNEVARAIANGNFSRRILRRRHDKLDRLAESLDQMATSLEKQFGELKEEKIRLETILNGMVEGVLVTDQRGRLILVNEALRKMFQLSGDVRGKSILECLRNADIHETIEETLKGENPQEREVVVFLRDEERTVMMHSAPLRERGSGAVSVFHDVTNIRRLENIRKDFVANVSHELKTPLTCIRGYAETLQQGALNDGPSAQKFLSKIEKNASQLQNLVEDILELSQLESGRMIINSVSLDAQPIISSVCEQFAELAKSKKITLKNLTNQKAMVLGDQQALRQVLGNLVENAIKYTQEGGEVTVRAEPVDGSLRFLVADTGMGIPEGDLPRIFERFYRVDKARSREAGGTGLGLSIVKHLVQAQGGEVGVRSEVGKGTEFWFTLPV